jgi:predicted phage baseplate assembly protein
VSYARLGSAPYQRPQLAWEYAAGPADAWAPLDVFDETSAFTNRGLVQFVGPPDLARRERFGQRLYWLRIRVQSGRFSVMPRLLQLATNTTWASQAITIHDELLGSGTGNAGLTVRLAQRPVLPGLLLDVREPDVPASGPQVAVAAAEEGIWVRWQAVPDFHGSGPRDRHFTLDSDSGEIRFGDGVHGMAPPPGQNNIRATRYRSGGGVAGNRAAGTIVELKTSLPYIDGGANIEAAFGGAERQSLDNAMRYGPRIVRHRGRAVTADDIEDLAYAASAEIARARVITPRFDPLSLYLDPRTPPGRPPTTPGDPGMAGTLGVVIVPQDNSARPTPTLGLLEDVRAYLLERCSAGARLWVAGPDWLEVVVRATVAASSLRDADAVRMRVLAALERYLHPLTGGPRATGWAFSRIPYPSELYALLNGVEGVDHVRELAVTTPSVEGAIPDTALIYSGTHQVRLVEH